MAEVRKMFGEPRGVAITPDASAVDFRDAGQGGKEGGVKQALHIFKKDVRYLRWEIGVFAAAHGDVHLCAASCAAY